MLVLKSTEINNRVDETSLIYHYLYNGNNVRVEYLSYKKPNEKIKVSYKGCFATIVKSNPKLSYTTFPSWSIDMLNLGHELSEIIGTNILFI